MRAVFAGSLLRAQVLFALFGASIALFLQELHGDWLPGLVKSNALSLPNRHRLLATMIIGAALGIVAGGVLAWRRGVPALTRASHVLAPLALLALIPPLMCRGCWDTLPAALAVGAFVLLAERVMRLCLAALGGPEGTRLLPPAWSLRIETLWMRVPARVRRVLPLATVILLALGYGLYMSRYTLFMHGRFQTYGYDLGQYDNIFFSALNGRPLRCAPLGLTENWSDLRNHADFSVYALLPFYALRPQADTLLVIQSMLLGLAAIPLFRIAARRVSPGIAVLLALMYLLYPPMHGFQFYDFHFQPIALFFVLWVIDFVDCRRYVLCGIALAIALGCREDISVGLAILGTFLAMSGHRVWPGLIIAAVSATYFVVIRFIVMPMFGSWFFQDIYKDLFPEGAHSFGGVIATLITNPAFTFKSLLTADKLRYALQILVPLAFLPLRRPYLAVALVPGFIFTLLTTGYDPTIDIAFQYSAHFIPYVFPAAALALASYGTSPEGIVKRRAAVVALVSATLLSGVFWGAIPPRERIRGGFFEIPMTAPTEADRKKHRDLQELFKMIPPDASVAISEAEMPHITGLHIRSLRDTTDADYLLYDTGSGYYGSDRANTALRDGSFVKLAERPHLALLRRVPKPEPGRDPQAEPDGQTGAKTR